jgi:hypothetical protein
VVLWPGFGQLVGAVVVLAPGFGQLVGAGVVLPPAGFGQVVGAGVVLAPGLGQVVGAGVGAGCRCHGVLPPYPDPVEGRLAAWVETGCGFGRQAGLGTDLTGAGEAGRKAKLERPGWPCADGANGSKLPA